MKLPFDESGLVWTTQSIVLPSIPGKLLQGNFHRKFSPHVETAPKEQLIPTREAQARQLMKNYILHYTNRRDMKLPFDESGLVWTAQSIVLPSIPGELLQGNFHRKFSPHDETAPMEQLIPTREQARQLTKIIFYVIPIVVI